MRIKVLAPHGCDRSLLDERGWTDVRDGARVADILKIIGCGRIKARILLVSVNGERSPLNRELHEGDIVGFFSPVSGG